MYIMVIGQFSMARTGRETLCRTLGMDLDILMAMFIGQSINKALVRTRKAENASSQEAKAHRKKINIVHLRKKNKQKRKN